MPLSQQSSSPPKAEQHQSPFVQFHMPFAAFCERLPVAIGISIHRLTQDRRINVPVLQKEGHNGEFQVLSVQLPSNCSGSPGFSLTVGPATQSEILVQTKADQNSFFASSLFIEHTPALRTAGTLYGALITGHISPHISRGVITCRQDCRNRLCQIRKKYQEAKGYWESKVHIANSHRLP